MTRAVLRLVRVGAAATAVVVAGLVLSACAPVSQVTFVGHGYGHGRGLGQWGAYGYAVDQGKDWHWILDHFYGGTVTQARPGAADPDQRVYMQEDDGRDLMVEQPAGRYTVAGSPAANAAVRVQRVDSTHWQVSDGPSCAGPWTPRAGTVASAELEVAPTQPSDDQASMLRLCLAGGKRLLRGSLIAVHVGSTIETVNRVDTESFVRSSIALEMSPSWGSAGSGKGWNALAAQAVAARSYVSAGDTRWGSWATTCDGGACLSYPGVAYAATGGSWHTYEDPRTDLATGATAGLVRVFPTGRIAATEFSASSGGYTTGPTFTNVPDDGDATSANPNHTWTVTISAATIQAAFSKRQGSDVGTLQGFDVTARDGKGADGGRPTQVQVRFSNTTVVLTGDQVRSTLGLRSSWFTPTAS